MRLVEHLSTCHFFLSECFLLTFVLELNDFDITDSDLERRKIGFQIKFFS